jgi:molybdopterin molybdotransferase
MDGYAVRAEDLARAEARKAVTLRLKGRIAAGESSSQSVGPGECIRIFTGSKMPAGSDAVVMQEDVRAEPGEIHFSEPVQPFENVRLAGEDVRAGTVLARRTQRLTAARIGLLAAAGCGEIAVHQRSRVALLATGNELREPGVPLREGEIYESNRAMLASFLSRLGADARARPIMPDRLDETTRALEEAFAGTEVIITTGGVSVGELDFVKEAFTGLGGTIDLWRVAMRPGKPFVFGRLGGKVLFGLPGNPVSAFVTFLLFVRPAILKMQGAADFDLPWVEGEIIEPIANRGDRRHFARMRWTDGKVRPTGPQKSHMLGSLAESNALLDMPPQSSYEAGRKVQVLLWGE